MSSDIDAIVIPAIIGGLGGSITFLVAKGFDSYFKYYKDRKYENIKQMVKRIFEKDYDNNLGWLCSGGKELELEKTLKPMVADLKVAYYNNDWEIVILIVNKIYKKSKCRLIEKKKWFLFKLWNDWQEERKYYKSARITSREIYRFIAFKHSIQDNEVNNKLFRKLIHSFQGDLTKNVEKEAYELLNGFYQDQMLIKDIKPKYAEIYIRFKDRNKLVSSRTLSSGYELEEDRMEYTFLYSKFFKFNSTLDIALKNFINKNNQKIEIEDCIRLYGHISIYDDLPKPSGKPLGSGLD